MSLKINKFLLLLLLLVLHLPALRAQGKPKPAGPLSTAGAERLHAIEDTLALLAYAVVNDSLELQRFGACKSLITTLVRALKTENSFKYPFERLRSSVSILAPPDSSFRIFTWQLFVNDSTYRYYGAIQMNRTELVLSPLSDRSFEMEQPLPLHNQLSAEHWYGVLYYNLRQFDTREGRKYLLFGYDAFSFFDKRKVVDVLSFDPAGKAVFGAPVFDGLPGRENGPGVLRLIFEYSAEASVRVNWDEEYQMVLFDHLLPMASPFGRGSAMVPDGSYDGLKLERGRWKWVDKVFNDVMDEAPRPEPVLEGRQGRDINGRERKTKDN